MNVCTFTDHRLHNFQACLKLGAQSLFVMTISATEEINKKYIPSPAAHHRAQVDFQMLALIYRQAFSKEIAFLPDNQAISEMTLTRWGLIPNLFCLLQIMGSFSKHSKLEKQQRASATSMQYRCLKISLNFENRMEIYTIYYHR